MVRDMLHEWEKVRQVILAGKITGFHTALRQGDDSETIYLGGAYKDPQEALRTILKVSMARMMAEEVASAPARANG